MKVMIIGGTSFIGPPLVRRLVDLGNRVAVFHRGQTRAELPPLVEHILGDRRDLEQHANEIRRFGPEVVVDMVAFTEADAIGLVDTFRGLARRSVVISSADVYRAYGRFIGLESGPLSRHRSVKTPRCGRPYSPIVNRPRDRTTLTTATTRSRLSGSCWAIPTCPAPCFACRWSTAPAISIIASLRISNEWMIAGRPSLSTRAWPAGSARVGTSTTLRRRSPWRSSMTGRWGACSMSPIRPPSPRPSGFRGSVRSRAGGARSVSVPGGRIPVPYHVEQNLDTDSGRIRQVLGYHEVVGPSEALERTIAWERTNPAGPRPGIGILDYDAEDALLAELGDSPG